MAFFSSIGNFISNVSSTAAYEFASFSSISSPTVQTISEIISEFFSNLLNHPTENTIALIVVIIIISAALIGLIFLAKKIYDYYQRTHP